MTSLPSSGELVFEAAELASIRRHGEEAFPEECCGILLAERAIGPGVRRRVSAVLAARNVSSEDRRRHYSIDPLDLLMAHKRARAEGVEVIGYYHSHPGGAARPSERDHREALPGYVYLILSVLDGKAVEFRCFRLCETEGVFEEQRWIEA